ncbi:MAG: YraN family protein [Betaproteobacteria bacterium]
MMTDHPSGVAAEELAARYLAARGLRVVARNFRCRFGEVDLIMQDGDALVFVEVRLRRSNRFGGALASITHAKQRKLVATARFYLSGLRHTPGCRFDAIVLDALDEAHIEWLRDIISE